MSIVDVSPQQNSRARPHGGRYYERRAAARAYEIYYILTVTAAFVVLLLCTTGMLVFVSKQSRGPEKDLEKDVCHERQVSTSDLEIAREEPTAAAEEPGHNPDIIDIPQISPLQHILRRDLWEHPLSEDDGSTQQRMQQLATMEESSLVIGEIVVTYDHREELSEYVRNQMEASRIISNKEANAILAMIHLNSTDLIFLHGHIGMLGSLRNSLTLALCTHKSGNIHFMLVILEVEAHLGWKTLRRGERSSWNLAMKAALQRKMKSETENLLGLAYIDSDSHAEQQWHPVHWETK